MCRKCDEFIKYSSDIGEGEKEQERLAELLAYDLDSIYNELKNKVQQGELEDYERGIMCQLLWNVGSQVFHKLPVLQERMVNAMGGQVLEFDWDIEYRKQMSEVRAEGRLDGANYKLTNQVCRKLSKGKTVEVIAEELEEELDVVQRICDIAKDYAPDYDVDAICERMQKVAV